jgi:hypothetical protein
MDESQPLLRNITPERHQQAYTNPLPDEDGGADIAETIIVDFDPRGDPDNPLEWPTPFKWTVVSMLAFMAFTVYVHAYLHTPFLGVDSTISHLCLPLTLDHRPLAQ